MSNNEWTPVFYTFEEFNELYDLLDGFEYDRNRNDRVRPEEDTFADFMRKGTDALLSEHLDLVKTLI